MGPEFESLVTLLDRGGLLGALVVIIWGGMRGWYVWRREYLELERDRNWWRSVAMRSLHIADASLSQSDTTGSSRDGVDRQQAEFFRDER
jgi:hypothetical protein